MPKKAQGLFETVLNNSQDISQSYYNDQALRNELSDDPAAFNDLLRAMRKQMRANGGIGKISSLGSAPITQQVEAEHIAGRIAAVDGTDAIRVTEVMSKSVYAAAVISVTATTLHEPRINRTASHRRIPSLSNEQDFFSFISHLDQFVDADYSWVHTFREHRERVEALRLLQQHNAWLVMIDGPLYTQNLLFQPIERHSILKAMNEKYYERLIGFIKNLHSSKVMHLAGMALRPDEYWTVSNWREVLADRFKKERERLQWIRSARTDWVRTIYRKQAKAYAFECHPDLVETGIALIASPICCADIINHEIPFLLHSADRIVQARVASAAKSENLISQLPYYANLANERTFR